MRFVWMTMIMGGFRMAGSLAALEPPQLTVVEGELRLDWEADAFVVLQVAEMLSTGNWEVVPDTMGRSEIQLAREGEMRYFRLARISNETFPAAITGLKSRVIDHVAARLRQATLPPAERGDVQFRLLENEATGDGSIPNMSGRDPFTWVSQPGMIRTYAGDTTEFHEAYPLYSTPSIIIGTKDSLQTEIAALSEWQADSARWVDMNEALLQDGVPTFPILDPAAMTVYGVEGLQVAPSEDGALPMPVRWLYVLEDGGVGILNSGGFFVGEMGAVATEENPIIARVAYWTDDESCKLNVNTASENIPWEKPHHWSERDKCYASDQPLTSEFQRHPGHPATTSLSSVLHPGREADADENPLTEDELKALYEITPSVRWHDENEQAVLPLDDDPLYETNKEVETRTEIPRSLVNGLLTAHSSAPEMTLHGRPRMNVWPVHVEDSPVTRSPDDSAMASDATLAGVPYYFQREERLSPYHDFYTAANGHNRDLYLYIMDQVYRDVPGVGNSLALKYGAVLDRFDYEHPIEYKLDHPHILLQMFDYIRQTNLIDGRVERPFAPKGDRGGYGQVTGLSLLDRNLYSMDVKERHLEGWHEPTLEPKASGRDYTVSEVAIVMYVTAQITMKNWDPETGPEFTSGIGPGPDLEIIKRIAANQHPEYADYRGKTYGPADVGKVLKYVEVGIIPELFSVAEGHHLIHPSQSLRLLTGGPGYAGGTSSELGIRVNGIPMNLWGDSVHLPTDLRGPGIMTVDPAREPIDVLNHLPAGWQPVGGIGGYRVMSFGSFQITEDTPGYVSEDFLANGRGPWQHLFLNAPIILSGNENLEITQESPLQLAMYDNTAAGATEGEVTQLFNVRLTPPEQALLLQAPIKNSAAYSGWSRRFLATHGKVGNAILERRESVESVTGMLPTHGDFRHISTKRHVPSELYRTHPRVGKTRSAHSLTWAVPTQYTSLARGATFLNELARRGLANVPYDSNVQPDVAFDPVRLSKTEYSPLLSEDYQFLIDSAITRDFDSGTGPSPDGSYINKPDDGANPYLNPEQAGERVPYLSESGFALMGYEDKAVANFVPQRMTPSPVSFGSLPSAVQANAPWTCLLFRPNLWSHRWPHLGERGNGIRYVEDRETMEGFQVPQFASLTDEALPADHHWLDLFWMPASNPGHVVSNYATKGKVNMNYQCFPFTGIKRATPLHAVLKSAQVIAIGGGEGRGYKNSANHDYRRQIDPGETLKQFEEKFAKQEVFVSESEICEQYLIPEGEVWDSTGETIRDYWNHHRLSGDNLLERPYAAIYPRLTTRSHAFRVHYRIQPISKAEDSPADQFVSGSDTVGEELRGESVIERRLEGDLPNYVADHQAPRMEHFLKARVVEERVYR